MRISDWSSDVCSSDLNEDPPRVDHLRQVLMRKVAMEPLLHTAAGGLPFGGRPQIAVSHHVPFQIRSEEHTSELQSLMRTSYAVFCLKKKKTITNNSNNFWIIGKTLSIWYN